MSMGRHGFVLRINERTNFLLGKKNSDATHTTVPYQLLLTMSQELSATKHPQAIPQQFLLQTRTSGQFPSAKSIGNLLQALGSALAKA